MDSEKVAETTDENQRQSSVSISDEPDGRSQREINADKFISKFHTFEKKFNKEGLQCPLCKNNVWELGPGTVKAQVDKWADSGAPPPPGYWQLPMIQLTCATCGLLMFFSSKQYGIDNGGE